MEKCCLFLFPKEDAKHSLFQAENYPEGEIYRTTLDYKILTEKKLTLGNWLFSYI